MEWYLNGTEDSSDELHGVLILLLVWTRAECYKQLIEIQACLSKKSKEKSNSTKGRRSF